MKYSFLSRTGVLLSAAAVAAVSGSLVLAQAGKEKGKTAAKPAAKAEAPAKSSGKSGKGSAKASPADAKLNEHLSANMKFLGVLSRYAQTLSSAKDKATAQQAAKKLETITKEAITAGEELVKLGKPELEVEMKLAGDADLKMTSQNVAEQTRAAVKTLAANAEVKAILAPAVENFQAALNRVQQAADENQATAHSPAGPPDNKAAAPEPAPPPPPSTPAGAPEQKETTAAADATEVPPPPAR